MPTLEIIGVPQSTYTRSVLMALIEKGVGHEVTPSQPHTPPVFAISPAGRVPVMRRGDVELCESRAIMGYIDTVFDGPPLMPTDPVGIAKAEQWISLLNTWIDRTMIREYLFAYIFPETPDKSPDRAKIEASLPVIGKQVAALDGALAQSPFLAGEALTISDLTLAPILGYVRNMGDTKPIFDEAANLSAYFDRMRDRKSFAETEPPSGG